MATMTQSTRLANGPSWDEEVVPALRKRLESESRNIARRISAISLSSLDGSPLPNFSILSETALRQASVPNTPYLQSSNRSPMVLQERTSSDRTHASSSSRLNGSSTPKRKTPSPSFQQQRSRTYSQPHFPNIPNGKSSGRSKANGNGNGKLPPPDTPRSSTSRPPDLKPTRIPKASRSNSSQPSTPIPISNGFPHTGPDSYNLHVVPESLPIDSYASNLAISNCQNPGLLNEAPPFQSGSASSATLLFPEFNDEAPPRPSNDSEERPFEHWYRGEVSRNGGVGELRVARRQEMLDIANYGHAIRAKANAHPPLPPVVDEGKRRKRADSVSRIEEKVRQRDSVYLNDEDASRIANVLDEDPLTDVDDGSDIVSISEHHTSIRHHYHHHRPPTGPEDLSTASAPVPRMSYDNRSTTPTPSLHRPSSRLQNGPPSRIPGPQPRRSSESRVTTPTQRSSSEPAPHAVMPPASTSSSSPGMRQRQPSKPTAVGAKRAASPHNAPSGTTTPRKTKTLVKATRTKATPSRKEQEDEAYRRSVASYPAPAGSDELMHAIPSWTQPVPRAGNWDDVVLPVVARNKGLDDQYEMADGNPTPKKLDNTVAPAPGTFGFRYRPVRDDSESIPMDEFGRPLAQNIPEEEAKREEAQAPPPQGYPTNSHDETRVPVQQQQRPAQPPSPPPFAEYAPKNEKVVPSPGRLRRPVELDNEKVDEGGAGCCKCVIM